MKTKQYEPDEEKILVKFCRDMLDFTPIAFHGHVNTVTKAPMGKCCFLDINHNIVQLEFYEDRILQFKKIYSNPSPDTPKVVSISFSDSMTGTICYDDMLFYVGEIMDFVPDGKGVLYSQDGQSSHAVFEKGKLISVNGIPQNESETESLKTINLIEKLNINMALDSVKEAVIGQPNLIPLLDAVKLKLLQVERDSTKPLYSALLTGPTSCGKSETAKALSQAIFGKKPFTIDCTTLYDKHLTASLIGAPDGYVNSDTPTPFLRYLKANRETGGVILIDEFDKAHVDCYNIFMSMLDEGVVHSAQQEAYNINNFILIFTSNHSANIAKSVGFSASTPSARQELVDGNGLRKELVGRMQYVCQYQKLTNQDNLIIAKRIMDKSIGYYSNLNGYNVKINYSEDFVKEIMSVTDFAFGVRQFRATAESILSTILSKFLGEDAEINLELSSVKDFTINNVHYSIDIKNRSITKLSTPMTQAVVKCDN